MGSTGGAVTVIEPWLREILRCPACRAELVDTADERGGLIGLACSGQSCGLRYPVEEGIPILLVDAGRAPH